MAFRRGQHEAPRHLEGRSRSAAPRYAEALNRHRRRLAYLEEDALHRGHVVSQVQRHDDGARTRVRVEWRAMHEEAPGVDERHRARRGGDLGARLGRLREIEAVVLNETLGRDPGRVKTHGRLRKTWRMRATSLRAAGSRRSTRVHASARRTAMRRGRGHPCAHGLAQRCAIHLEDAQLQAPAIQDLKAGRTLVGVGDEAPRVPGRRPLGVSFRVKGVIDGSRRTRQEVRHLGRHPLSGIRYPVSSGDAVAKTATGTRGVHRVVFYHPERRP